MAGLTTQAQTTASGGANSIVRRDRPVPRSGQADLAHRLARRMGMEARAAAGKLSEVWRQSIRPSIPANWRSQLVEVATLKRAKPSGSPLSLISRTASSSAFFRRARRTPTGATHAHRSKPRARIARCRRRASQQPHLRCLRHVFALPARCACRWRDLKFVWRLERWQLAGHARAPDSGRGGDYSRDGIVQCRHLLSLSVQPSWPGKADPCRERPDAFCNRPIVSLTFSVDEGSHWLVRSRLYIIARYSSDPGWGAIPWKTLSYYCEVVI